jgi:hypothetical protein
MRNKVAAYGERGRSPCPEQGNNGIRRCADDPKEPARSHSQARRKAPRTRCVQRAITERSAFARCDERGLESGQKTLSGKQITSHFWRALLSQFGPVLPRLVQLQRMSTMVFLGAEKSGISPKTGPLTLQRTNSFDVLDYGKSNEPRFSKINTGARPISRGLA